MKRARTLAATALREAIAGRNGKAADAIQAICDETGGAGLSYAICAWIDTTTARLRKLGYLPEPGGTPVRLAFIGERTGNATGADEVPAPVAWAGQMAAARVAGDQETWAALVAALPDDHVEASQYIWALLSGAALTIKDSPHASEAGVR